MGKERIQMNFEQLGAVVLAPENSPFKNATFRNLGTLHGYKGNWKSTSFVEYTCTNGDKIYATSEAEGTAPLQREQPKDFSLLLGGLEPVLVLKGLLR